MDHSNSMGGGDVDEARRRAKHRGRAYQCLACFHKEGNNTINEKGKIEFHILKNHVKLKKSHSTADCVCSYVLNETSWRNMFRDIKGI